MPRLVCLNLCFMLKREPDVVESVQQTMADEFIHGKLRTESLVVPHFTLLQIDGELVVVDLLGTLHQLSHFVVGQPHGKKSIFCAVIGENVRERRGDHRAEAEVGQRPHRMLARRPAAKILSRDQNACSHIARLVEHEVRVLPSLCAEPPVIKEKLAKTRALDSLQKLLWDDLIGIHIDAVERRYPAAMACEWLHSALL